MERGKGTPGGTDRPEAQGSDLRPPATLGPLLPGDGSGFTDSPRLPADCGRQAAVRGVGVLPSPEPPPSHVLTLVGCYTVPDATSTLCLPVRIDCARWIMIKQPDISQFPCLVLCPLSSQGTVRRGERAELLTIEGQSTVCRYLRMCTSCWLLGPYRVVTFSQLQCQPSHQCIGLLQRTSVCPTSKKSGQSEILPIRRRTNKAVLIPPRRRRGVVRTSPAILPPMERMDGRVPAEGTVPDPTLKDRGRAHLLTPPSLRTWPRTAPRISWPLRPIRVSLDDGCMPGVGDAISERVPLTTGLGLRTFLVIKTYLESA